MSSKGQWKSRLPHNTMWDTSGQSETPEDAEEMTVQGDKNKKQFKYNFPKCLSSYKNIQQNIKLFISTFFKNNIKIFLLIITRIHIDSSTQGPRMTQVMWPNNRCPTIIPNKNKINYVQEVNANTTTFYDLCQIFLRNLLYSNFIFLTSFNYFFFQIIPLN